jgi:hypothetical protein
LTDGEKPWHCLTEKSIFPSQFLHQQLRTAFLDHFEEGGEREIWHLLRAEGIREFREIQFA